MRNNKFLWRYAALNLDPPLRSLFVLRQDLGPDLGRLPPERALLELPALALFEDAGRAAIGQ